MRRSATGGGSRSNVASSLSRLSHWAKRLFWGLRTRQRIEITLEIDHAMLIHQGFRVGWCGRCGSDGGTNREALFPRQHLLGIPASGGRWHLVEGDDGVLFVCLGPIAGSKRR
jgi:hypothetical protein